MALSTTFQLYCGGKFYQRRNISTWAGFELTTSWRYALIAHVIVNPTTIQSRPEVEYYSSKSNTIVNNLVNWRSLTNSFTDKQLSASLWMNAFYLSQTLRHYNIHTTSWRRQWVKTQLKKIWKVFSCIKSTLTPISNESGNNMCYMSCWLPEGISILRQQKHLLKYWGNFTMMRGNINIHLIYTHKKNPDYTENLKCSISITMELIIYLFEACNCLKEKI